MLLQSSIKWLSTDRFFLLTTSATKSCRISLRDGDTSWEQNQFNTGQNMWTHVTATQLKLICTIRCNVVEVTVQWKPLCKRLQSLVENLPQSCPLLLPRGHEASLLLSQLDQPPSPLCSFCLPVSWSLPKQVEGSRDQGGHGVCALSCPENKKRRDKDLLSLVLKLWPLHCMYLCFELMLVFGIHCTYTSWVGDENRFNLAPSGFTAPFFFFFSYIQLLWQSKSWYQGFVKVSSCKMYIFSKQWKCTSS